MALESATYLEGLVTTNPVGATDSRRAGDDHLRLIKTVLKNTFPGFDQAQAKAKINATSAPGVGDDTADGFAPGSFWIDVTNDKVYVCLDATGGAAIWREVLLNGSTIGDCYFKFSSSTQLLLMPFNGNKILINGEIRTIPSVGVALGTGGLSANTVYLVFAYWTGSAIALEVASLATGYVQSATFGVYTKNGDATRTLVGMCRTNGSTQFYDDGFDIGVLSWFNKRKKIVQRTAPTSGTFVTSAGTYTQVTPVTQVNALNWSGFLVRARLNGMGYGSAGAVNLSAAVGRDGVAQGSPSTSSAHATNYYCVASGDDYGALSEGNHVFDARIATNGAQITIPANSLAFIVEVEG